MDFLDPSVSVTSPNGHLEPLPIILGPTAQPNDVRVSFISGSGVDNGSDVGMPMNPDPPTGFTKAYALNQGVETHGVYYKRIAAGDSDSADPTVSWPKPPSWRHFMFATITARGVDPTSNPTAGSLSPPGPGITYIVGDSTDSATVGSVTVPGTGVMVFFLGNVGVPWQTSWPNWPVSLGIPDGWTHIAATDKSGNTFYQYGTDPALVVVGKGFTSSGSTGSVEFPAAQGAPAFAGGYIFLPGAPDISITIGAA